MDICRLIKCLCNLLKGGRVNIASTRKKIPKKIDYQLPLLEGKILNRRHYKDGTKTLEIDEKDLIEVYKYLSRG